MSFDDFQSMKTLRNWPILLLRVYTGIFFAYYGFRKIVSGSFTEGLAGFLSSRAEDSVGWYRVIVEAVIVPMQGLFAFLVAYGELALGMALIIGLATRYAAFAGAFTEPRRYLVRDPDRTGGPACRAGFECGSEAGQTVSVFGVRKRGQNPFLSRLRWWRFPAA
jgi:uncharacterized membrane protein YphA (DoxX/SURF4 family)